LPTAPPERFVTAVHHRASRRIPVDAILGVHDEKVIVDVARLPASLQAAIGHAHEQEVRGL
jgi:hypothetical protein